MFRTQDYLLLWDVRSLTRASPRVLSMPSCAPLPSVVLCFHCPFTLLAHSSLSSIRINTRSRNVTTCREGKWSHTQKSYQCGDPMVIAPERRRRGGGGGGRRRRTTTTTTTRTGRTRRRGGGGRRRRRRRKTSTHPSHGDTHSPTLHPHRHHLSLTARSIPPPPPPLLPLAGVISPSSSSPGAFPVHTVAVGRHVQCLIHGH